MKILLLFFEGFLLNFDLPTDHAHNKSWCGWITSSITSLSFRAALTQSNKTSCSSVVLLFQPLGISLFCKLTKALLHLRGKSSLLSLPLKYLQRVLDHQCPKILKNARSPAIGHALEHHSLLTVEHQLIPPSGVSQEERQIPVLEPLFTRFYKGVCKKVWCTSGCQWSSSAKTHRLSTNNGWTSSGQSCSPGQRSNVDTKQTAFLLLRALTLISYMCQ